MRLSKGGKRFVFLAVLIGKLFLLMAFVLVACGIAH
jgi:hypothetical protein